jgi:hypothetical protein
MACSRYIRRVRGSPTEGSAAGRPLRHVTGTPGTARGDGLLAAGVLVFMACAVVTGCVLGGRGCLRALRRRRQRLQWENLVARHQELDRELEKIWQHR